MYVCVCVYVSIGDSRQKPPQMCAETLWIEALNQKNQQSQRNARLKICVRGCVACYPFLLFLPFRTGLGPNTTQRKRKWTEIGDSTVVMRHLIRMCYILWCSLQSLSPFPSHPSFLVDTHGLSRQGNPCPMQFIIYSGHTPFFLLFLHS